MYCEYCGTEISDTANFCRICGKPVKRKRKDKKQKIVSTIKKENIGNKSLKIDEKEKQKEYITKTDEDTEKQEQQKTHGILWNIFSPFNLTTLAFISGIIGQYFLYYKKLVTPGLIFFGIGILLFLIAHILSDKNYEEKTFNKKLEIFLFLLILIIGIFYRVYKIDTIPAGCFSDEAQCGREALNIIHQKKIEGTTLPVYLERETSHNPAMYVYFIAVFFKLFGVNCTNIRLTTAFLGLLGIPAFYFLLRNLLGVRSALLGAFLFTTMHWHVNFSRIGFRAVFSVFVLILFVYFLVRVYKKQKLSDFLLFGLTTALTQYTYQPIRFVLIYLIIFGIYVLIKSPSLYVKNFKKLILAIIVGIIVFAPLANYIVHYPKKYFFGRAKQTVVLNERVWKEFYHGRFKSPWEVIKYNAKLTFLMFNKKGDTNPRHNYPEKPTLEFFPGIFAFLGFGYALFTLFNLPQFLFITGFFVFILGGLLTIEAPQALRNILTLPFIVGFMVLFLNRYIHFLNEQYRKKVKIIFYIILFLVLGYSAYESYDIYFNKQPKHKLCWEEFSTTEYLIGKYILSKGKNWHFIMLPSYRNHYTTKFITNEYKDITTENFEPANSIPVKSYYKKNFAYILPPDYEPIIPLLKEMYPNGRYIPFYNKYDKSRELFFVYEIPYSDVVKYRNKKIKNGLTGYYYRGPDWKGSYVIKRVDPFILFNWTVNPVPGKFSVEWRGKLKIDKEGEYEFMMETNDYCDLYIDRKRIVEVRRGGYGGTWKSRNKIYLKKGFHNIRVRYSESIHYSMVKLFWKKPGDKKFSVVAHNSLFPEK